MADCRICGHRPRVGPGTLEIRQRAKPAAPPDRRQLPFGSCSRRKFHGLLACDVSPTRRPDFDRDLAVRSQPPSAVHRAFQDPGLYRNDPALAAAKQALANIPWITPNTVAIDRPNREIVVGAVGTGVDATVGKKALQDAGYKVGEVSVQPVKDSDLE